MQPKKQLKFQYIGIFEEIDSFYWPKKKRFICIDVFPREGVQKMGKIEENFLKKEGGGSAISKLYVKFCWPLFLAFKNWFIGQNVTFWFLNTERRGVRRFRKFS